MSIKIYTAYKLRRTADLWPVCRDAHQKALEVVREVISKLYLNIAAELPKDPTKSLECDLGERLNLAREKVLERYKATLGSTLRDPFNLDVAIGIWHHRGGYYFRPFCDELVRNALTCLDEDPRLAPFGYWNNTDRPDEVSVGAWERRRLVWAAIQDQYDEHGNPHLSMEVMSYSRLQNYLGDPLFELQRKAKAGELVW